MTRCGVHDRGFTVVELTVVFAIVAILLVMAVPLFVSSRVTAAKRTCYANQRALEGAAAAWVAADTANSTADLQGVVDSTHPLSSELGGGRIPSCPDGDEPLDPRNPTIAEGAYSFDAGGTLDPCTFGDLGPHGHY